MPDINPTATQQNIERAEGGSENKKVLIYPRDLGQLQNNDYVNYILFDIYERSGPLKISDKTKAYSNVQTVEGGTVLTDQPKGAVLITTGEQGLNSNIPEISSGGLRSNVSIVLYLPQKISTQYGPQWNTVETGVTASVIKSVAATGRDLKAAMNSNNSEELGAVFKGITNLIPGMGTVALNAGEVAEGLGFQGAKALIEKAQGATLNPYQEVIFNGVSNRAFEFTFKFLPQDSKEASTIIEIIRQFKYHSHPENIGIARLEFPSEFGIGFYRIDPKTKTSTRNSFLFKMDLCACTNVMVDYAPTGTFKTFPDGMPVEIDLTLQFTEMTTLTKSKIEAGY